MGGQQQRIASETWHTEVTVERLHLQGGKESQTSKENRVQEHDSMD
jgi:hypothetical protein